MDIVDMSQERIDRAQAELIKRARLEGGTSLTLCQDCGTEIPEKRRSALPGCKTCRECAGKRELRSMEGF